MSISHHIPPVYPCKDVDRSPDSWAKVSSYVPREDWQTINALAAQSGAISYIIDHAIHTTAVAIRTAGLTPIVDTPRFFEWLRQRTFSEFAASPQGKPGDDAGRASGACEPASHPTDVPAGAGSNDASRRRRGGRKARAGEA